MSEVTGREGPGRQCPVVTGRERSGWLCTMVTFLVVLALVQGVGSWPEGTYGLPMPKSGCPAASDFEWETGTRTHKTEAGSKASKSIHLAGIEKDKTDKIVQTFCMKTAYPKADDHEFQPGRYCIFKKADCPAGFKEGFIYWDDNAPWFGPTIQNYSGTIPDGEYTRNTKMFYCCRNDGMASKAIDLPALAPFYLLKWGEQCQEVKRMDVTEEWVYWADESSLNLNEHGGLYPKVIRSKYPSKYTQVYYCYYTPKGPNTALKTTLTVVYVLAAVIGCVIFIFIIFCLIQKCCTRKQPAHFIDNNADNTAREAMLAPPITTVVHENGEVKRPEPSVVYRPSANGFKPPSDSVTFNKTYPQPTSPPPPDVVSGAACAALVPEPLAPDYPMMERPMSQPPSYDDVIRQISTEDQDSARPRSPYSKGPPSPEP